MKYDDKSTIMIINSILCIILFTILIVCQFIYEAIYIGIIAALSFYLIGYYNNQAKDEIGVRRGGYGYWSV